MGSQAISKGMGNLLYHIATRFKGHRGRASMLVKYIAEEKLTSELQLAGELRVVRGTGVLHKMGLGGNVSVRDLKHDSNVQFFLQL